MHIFLVRHAKASKDPQYKIDAERPITRRGREDISKVAKFMADSGVEVHQIRHSGLLRARQTADILRDYLKPPEGVLAVRGLHPSDPVETLARELHMEPEPVMFVGHNPFMEDLTSVLLTRAPGRVPVWFTTSCVAYLRRTNGEWSVRWVLNRQIVSGVE
jgi:phosphohistidine phosphatase